MFAFHRAANFDKIYLIASDFKCLKHHVRCDHTNKINFIQLYFWTQSQFQGLCCLKLLFACNTQLQRVVMYFEIRWIEGKHAWGSARLYFMPNSKQYSSCFANAPASNKHYRKGPQDPPPAPCHLCLPSACCHACVPDLPLHHIFGYYSYERLEINGLTSQEWLLLTRKSTSQRIQA